MEPKQRKERLWENDEIVPRKVVRPPVSPGFVKQKVGYAKGKSIKYLIEVTIPHLRSQVLMLRKKLKERRGRVLVEKELKVEAVKKAKALARAKALNIHFASRRRMKKRTQRKIKDAASKMYYDRVKSQRMHNSNYIDGVTAYPILTQFCKEQNIHPPIFNAFIIMCHFEWFRPEDLIIFDFKPDTLRVYIKKLITAELIQTSLNQGRKSYSVTLKGRLFFQKFQVFYSFMTHKLFQEYDKFNNRSKKGILVEREGRHLSISMNKYILNELENKIKGEHRYANKPRH